MTRLFLYAALSCLSFYGLLFDMCNHLDGWRVLEPLALWCLSIVMLALGYVLFPREGAPWR
jgi:hypothetical protein